MYQRGVLVIALLLTGVGGGLAIGAGVKSKELTGEWLGYPLPNAVAAAGGIGLLSFAFGLLLLIAYITLSIADRPSIRRVLEKGIVSDNHFIARLGHTVLRAQRAWDFTIGVLLLAVVVYLAITDALSALILGGTALVVAVIYYLAKRRPAG